MASQFDTIGAFLKAQLETITDIGNVYLVEPDWRDKETRNTSMEYTLTAAPDAGDIVYRFWTVDCNTISPDLMTGGQTAFPETWTLDGYWGYVDATKTYASKTKVQEFWRDTLKAFYTNLDYQSVAIMLDPISSDLTQFDIFGGIVCWRIRIQMQITYDESFNC